jgi:hypothetical protein
VASFIYRTDPAWVPAAIAGIIVGAAWNYAVTGIFTWGRFRTVVGRDTTDSNRIRCSCVYRRCRYAAEFRGLMCIPANTSRLTIAAIER